jgi:hypothetical protein
LALIALTIAGIVNGFQFVDGLGFISHTVETGITAQQNWFVGETKYCSSFPTPPEFASPDSPAGFALNSVRCDDGPSHQVKIAF